MKFRRWLSAAVALMMCAAGCCAEGTEELGPVKTYDDTQVAALEARFAGVSYAKSLKGIAYDAPVMTQRLGADPFALVYEDRVYLYMTADVVERDASGKVKDNSYSRINKLNVVSSADLINWTDHGSIPAAGPAGAARWGNNSWAPAAACKEVDGRMQFFIYFANGGNGIGVLQGDSPTGPFVDPLGKALVSRSTPNCNNVTWLFDPAVMVDEDGSAYLYFGGGIPNGRFADPGTGRVVKLSDDMIHLDGTPQALDVPYLFEDSGINRIGDTYYYSYCSNWNVPVEARRELGIDNAQIVYMTSDNPMGPFTLGGVVLKNPGTYYGCYGNNHHCMFQFHGEWYIAYHTQMLESLMGISGGYRATSVSKLKVQPDGSIPTLQTIKRDSLEQVGTFDPYQLTSAATMATMGGLKTKPLNDSYPCGDMVLTDIHSGSWAALRGVNFGEGATTFTATINTGDGNPGAIALRLDRLNGPTIGYLDWTEADGAGRLTLTATLTTPPTDVHNLILLFDGEGYTVESWMFGE